MKPIFAEEIHENLDLQDDALKAWLEMLWLRPACALQKALEMKHFMRFFPFKGPAADLGCGDGTHSALICGARFNPDFDMYLSINKMRMADDKVNDHRIHFKKADNENEYFKGGDPYLFFDKNQYEGKINYTKEPQNKFSWGCDLADALVKKAELLKIYDRVSVNDLSKPLECPSNQFSTIYSNVSYWMDDKKLLFNEQNRILKDDGISVMTAQDPIIHSEIALTAIVKNQLNEMGYTKLPKWVEEVDRGRIAQTTGKLLSVDEWNKLFDSTGFEILYHGQFMSRDAYWQYDLDLRETFPSDVALSQDLNSMGSEGAELRKAWKNSRVNHYFSKWKQYFHDYDNWQKNLPRAWNFFVIKKKGAKSWADSIAAQYYKK